MKVRRICILLQLQQTATRKIEDLSNYFGISKEDKGEKAESAHEICRISDGCGCEKRKALCVSKAAARFYYAA